MSKHSASSSSIAREHKCATKSRKRIHTRKIEDPTSRQTTFSKRRNGFFKKSAHLAACCGAEVATVVFSRYGRPFIFGYPSLDTALHGGQEINSTSDDTETTSTSTIAKSNSIGSNSSYQISTCPRNIDRVGGDMGLVREEEEAAKGGSNAVWWEQLTDMMNLQELEEFRASLQKLKDNVAIHLDEMTIRKLALRDFLGVNLNF